MTTWVYIQSEKNLYTVGFYDTSGIWHSEQDYASREIAANRVHFLNGNAVAAKRISEIKDELGDLIERVNALESAAMMQENVALYGGAK